MSVSGSATPAASSPLSTNMQSRRPELPPSAVGVPRAWDDEPNGTRLPSPAEGKHDDEVSGAMSARNRPLGDRDGGVLSPRSRAAARAGGAAEAGPGFRASTAGGAPSGGGGRDLQRGGSMRQQKASRGETGAPPRRAMTARGGIRSSIMGPPPVGVDGKQLESVERLALSGKETEARVNRALAEWEEKSGDEMRRLLRKLRADHDALRARNKQLQRETAAVTAELERVDREVTAERERAGAAGELSKRREELEEETERAAEALADAKEKATMYVHMETRLKEQRHELDREIGEFTKEESTLEKQVSEAQRDLSASRASADRARTVATHLGAQVEAARERRTKQVRALETAIGKQQARRSAVDDRERRRLTMANLPRGDLDEAGEERLKQLFLVRRIFGSMLARRLREDTRRLDRLDAAFRRVRVATGLSAAPDIVAKFRGRDRTRVQLLARLRAARRHVDTLRQERRRLTWAVDAAETTATREAGRRGLYVRLEQLARQRDEARRLCHERRARLRRAARTLEAAAACTARMLRRMGVSAIYAPASGTSEEEGGGIVSGGGGGGGGMAAAGALALVPSPRRIQEQSSAARSNSSAAHRRSERNRAIEDGVDPLAEMDDEVNHHNHHQNHHPSTPPVFSGEGAPMSAGRMPTETEEVAAGPGVRAARVRRRTSNNQEVEDDDDGGGNNTLSGGGGIIDNGGISSGPNPKTTPQDPSSSSNPSSNNNNDDESSTDSRDMAHSTEKELTVVTAAALEPALGQLEAAVARAQAQLSAVHEREEAAVIGRLRALGVEDASPPLAASSFWNALNELRAIEEDMATLSVPDEDDPLSIGFGLGAQSADGRARRQAAHAKVLASLLAAVRGSSSSSSSAAGGKGGGEDSEGMSPGGKGGGKGALRTAEARAEAAVTASRRAEASTGLVGPLELYAGGSEGGHGGNGGGRFASLGDTFVPVRRLLDLLAPGILGVEDEFDGGRSGRRGKSRKGSRPKSGEEIEDDEEDTRDRSEEAGVGRASKALQASAEAIARLEAGGSLLSALPANRIPGNVRVGVRSRTPPPNPYLDDSDDDQPETAGEEDGAVVQFESDPGAAAAAMAKLDHVKQSLASLDFLGEDDDDEDADDWSTDGESTVAAKAAILSGVGAPSSSSNANANTNNPASSSNATKRATSTKRTAKSISSRSRNPLSRRPRRNRRRRGVRRLQRLLAGTANAGDILLNREELKELSAMVLTAAREAGRTGKGGRWRGDEEDQNLELSAIHTRAGPADEDSNAATTDAPVVTSQQQHAGPALGHVLKGVPTPRPSDIPTSTRNYHPTASSSAPAPPQTVQPSTQTTRRASRSN